MKQIPFIWAEQEAIDEEMARDERVFVIGECVAWRGGDGKYRGIAQKYGVERVRDTAISETAIVGGAIGAAMTGMRPIANLMMVDFIGCCGDELLNQLQMRYMLAGQDVKVPLTMIAMNGAGICGAAQHSKCLEGYCMSFRGLKVVVPSNPYDAKGLLKSAIRDDNPVIYLSHRAMMMSTGEIPDEEYLIPLGKADIKREGKDVTVVATGLMVNRALAAGATLQERGVSIEVIDPRTLVPLDKQTIIDSVKKTGRLVIMTEEPRTGGSSVEISAIVAEEAFHFLHAPIKIVCAPDTPVPFSPVLEKFWMPDEENLISAVNEIV